MMHLGKTQMEWHLAFQWDEAAEDYYFWLRKMINEIYNSIIIIWSVEIFIGPFL